MDISTYSIYQGKDVERVQVFIAVEKLSLEEAEEQLHVLSSALKEKMTKNWKCLPSTTLPEAYNIISIPYTQL